MRLRPALSLFALSAAFYGCHEKSKKRSEPAANASKKVENARSPESLYEAGLEALENHDTSDDLKGRELIVRAAEAGLLDAQYSAGVCLQRGLGGPTGPDEAFMWFEKAGERGQRDAQYKLAHAYRTGVPLPKDEARSRELYLSAAKKGHGHAQYNIAVAYERGMGGPADIGEAIKWYELRLV